VLDGATIDGLRRRFRRDGTPVDVRIRCTPIVDIDGDVSGMLVLAEDVTERVRTEEELRQTQEIHRRVIENITDVISLIDPKGGVVFSTGPQAALDSGGDDRRWFAARIHPDDRHKAQAAIQAALAGAPSESTEVRIRTDDGMWHIYEGIAVSVRDDNGVPEMAMAITRDITERRQLETERAQAHRLESVGRLTAGVAHDFNNLLTVISGYTEIAGSTLGGDSSLDEIRAATARGARLTHQLLAFSRQQVLQLETLDVNQIVLEIRGMLGPLLDQHIRLEHELTKGLWACAADRGQLEQVIVNLALNARDAMPDGGTLRIATENVVLDEDWAAAHAGGVPGQQVALTVSDTGQGMDDATLGRIFEPFFTTKAAGTGHGLGLSSTYGIVKQSGGYLDVESSPGEGSTFRVYLPRAEPEAAPPASVDPPAASRSDEGSTTILLVEDDERVRRLVETMLGDLDVRVVAVASAEEALERLADESFDLLLSDISMPAMSGTELALRVRESRPDLPILLTSGYVLGDSHGPAGTRLLQKPFSKDELAAAVASALQHVT
jgi:signal transduction histidine kinase